MAATFDTLRIGETIVVDATALDQTGDLGFIDNTNWQVDAGSIVAGDPTTTHGITSSSVANPTHITTSTAHGLVTGDRVTITGHTGSTPAIADNSSWIVTVLSPTVFTIAVNVTVGGSGGSEHRSNGEIVETLAGPPPNPYQATLTGKASGAGKITLAYDDAFADPGTATKTFTVLNASGFSFSSIYIVDGVLILSFQDGAGPGVIPIASTPIDSRGSEIGAPSYVVTGYQWVDAAGNLALTNATTATVSVEGTDQGDGTLTLQGTNSAGVVITSTLPYRVISTATVVLEQN